MGLLLGRDGAAAAASPERAAGLSALRACMADAAEALFPPLRAALAAQLDRQEHDALSVLDINKWTVPEGMLAAEVSVQNGFKAEVVEDKNVRKVRRLCCCRLIECSFALLRVSHIYTQPC